MLIIAIIIALQVLVVWAAHTISYIWAVKCGLKWSVQDYFTVLGVTLLRSLGIWIRVVRALGTKLRHMLWELGFKLGQKRRAKR